MRELELRSQALGLIVNYVVDDPDAVGNGVDEVRVHNLSTTKTYSIATVEPGEGGQIYVDLSLTDDYLGFVRACEGDSGGCIGRSRIYRHHLHIRRSQIAPGRYRGLTGMALLNNGNSLQIDPDPGDVAELGLTSSLILAGPISWRIYQGPF